MLKSIMLLALVVPTLASANGDTNSSWQAYHEEDRFQWTNYDNGVHLLSAYALTFTASSVLKKHFGFSTFGAALASTVTVALLGITKEVMFDEYTSRNDMQCYAAGAIAGGITFTVIEF